MTLLWLVLPALLLLFVVVATRTSDGVRADLGGIGSDLAPAVRQLLLAGV